MRFIVIALIVGSALGFSAAPTASIGTVHSYTAELRYDMAVDVDAEGVPRSAQAVAESRRVLAVPEFYGELISVTQQDTVAILWYRDAGGAVRNVSVEHASGVGYTIEKRAAGRASLKVAR